jgi:hypothetical protein
VTQLTTPSSEQRTEAVRQVLTETFDAVHDLDVDGREAPAVDEAYVLARAAHERKDFVGLDEHLKAVITAAIVGRAQLRIKHPDLGAS